MINRRVNSSLSPALLSANRMFRHHLALLTTKAAKRKGWPSSFEGKPA
jgi:hypothetical protein